MWSNEKSIWWNKDIKKIKKNKLAWRPENMKDKEEYRK